MAIQFSQIPANIRVPFFYAEVDDSQAGEAIQPKRTLLIGGLLAAGSAAADTLVQIGTAEDAATAFGRGSQLHRMVELYRMNDSFGELWCIGISDPAGVKAAGTITVGGTATENGVLKIYVGGQLLEVPVEDLDNQAAMQTAILAAFTADGADLPVTAAAGGGAGEVDLTAVHAGLLGNDIDVRFNYRGAEGGEVLPAGVTLALTTPMAGGTLTPSLTSAIAAMGDEPFRFIGHAYGYDDTALDSVDTELDHNTGRWNPLRRVYGCAVSADVDTRSALSTHGNGRNGKHQAIFGFYDAPTPPWEWAAGILGQIAPAGALDPARPFQTLAVRGLLPPAPTSAGRFTVQERQILLYDGIATTTYDTLGNVRIERAITTYQLNGGGIPDTAWLDLNTTLTLAEVLEQLEAEIVSKFPRHKLADDLPGGTRTGPGQAILTPKIARGAIVAKYAELEAAGLVENMAAFKRHLVVERNGTDPTRLDVLFPPDLVNQARIFAVLAQFRLQFPADA